MKAFASFLKDVLKVEQSRSDRCIFYKKIQGKVILTREKRTNSVTPGSQ
jgi:hypothetical protein